MVKPAPTPFYIFQDFKDGATSLSFENFNGQTFLIAGSGNGVCKILNLQTMKSNLELCFSNGLDFQTSGNSVLKCGKWSNGVWAHVRMVGIHFWKLSSDFTVLEKFFIESNFAGFCAACVSKMDDFQELVVIPRDKQLDIFSLQENKYEFSRSINFNQTPKLGMPMCMKICMTREQSCHLLLIGFENGEIHAWNLKNNLHISSIKLHDEAVICVEFVTGCGGISGSVDNKIKFFNFKSSDELEDQMLLESKSCLTIPHNGVSSINIRNDRKIFACGCWDGKIRIFCVKSSKPLAVLNLHTDSIQYLVFDETFPKNNKRKYLAAASKDETVSLWSIYEDV